MKKTNARPEQQLILLHRQANEAKPVCFRGAHSQFHTMSSSGSSTLLGLPCRDWVSFPAPTVQTNCSTHPNATMGNGGTRRPTFFVMRINLEEELVSAPGFIFYTHLLALPQLSCKTPPWTIPTHRESGAALCTPISFPGDVGGQKVLKGDLSTFPNHPNLLLPWEACEPFSSPFFFFFLQTSEKKPGHLFRQTTGGTASPH